MPSIKKEFSNLEAFLFDMDGVLYIGESPIRGSKEAIYSLRREGKKIALLTNNSTKSRKSYEKKFSEVGLEIDKSNIITSSYATALYLSENYKERKVYVIGEAGLKTELEEAGFDILSRKDSKNADFVVVGMDRGLTYDKIWGGLSALLSGAEFIATNSDPTYPTEQGLSPGAGASIGALSGSSKREPSTDIGKPSTYMIDTALDILGVPREKTAIVGDRIDMDIKAGNRAGLTSILVLTGVDDRDNANTAVGTEAAPDYVISDLLELLE